MDRETLIAWLLDRATRLYAHDGQLYVQPGGLATHLHRVGAARCPDNHCTMSEGDMAQVLKAHETALWEVLATEPCCAVCYDVETDTWRPDWVAVDDDGRPCRRDGLEAPPLA